MDKLYFVKAKTNAYTTKDFQGYDNYTTVKNQFFVKELVPQHIARNFETHRADFIRAMNEYIDGVSNREDIDPSMTNMTDLQKKVPDIAALLSNHHLIFRDDIHGSPLILVVRSDDVYEIKFNDKMLDAIQNGRDFKVAVTDSNSIDNSSFSEVVVPYKEISRRLNLTQGYSESILDEITAWLNPNDPNAIATVYNNSTMDVKSIMSTLAKIGELSNHA